MEVVPSNLTVMLDAGPPVYCALSRPLASRLASPIRNEFVDRHIQGGSIPLLEAFCVKHKEGDRVAFCNLVLNTATVSSQTETTTNVFEHSKSLDQVLQGLL